MTRAEKIKFLQGIVTGNASIADLKHKELTLFVGYPGKLNLIDGQEANEGQFAEEMERQRRAGPSNDPLVYQYGPER